MIKLYQSNSYFFERNDFDVLKKSIEISRQFRYEINSDIWSDNNQFKRGKINKDEFDMEEINKDGFKKEETNKDEFKKEETNKNEFNKEETNKDEFKKEETNNDEFKKNELINSSTQQKKNQIHNNKRIKEELINYTSRLENEHDIPICSIKCKPNTKKIQIKSKEKNVNLQMENLQIEQQKIDQISLYKALLEKNNFLIENAKSLLQNHCPTTNKFKFSLINKIQFRNQIEITKKQIELLKEDNCNVFKIKEI